MAVLALTFGTSTPGVGDEGALDRCWNASGWVAVESRWFPEFPIDPEQLERFQPSVAVQPELEFEAARGEVQGRLVGFARVDDQDPERTHVDLREGYAQFFHNDVEVLFGMNRVFWGVTESRHLVDVINQTDGVEDIDEEDKLGQPMLRVELLRDWGTLSYFVLPLFRERTFPGPDGRLRGALPVSTNAAEYESDAGRWHVDHALRYSHYLGDWDVGGYYFFGTGREPVLRPNQEQTELIPSYRIIHQTGVDVQYTTGPWLLKGEGVWRSGHGADFLASTTGFEYTFFQVFGARADVGPLAEYHYDGRGASAPRTLFDRDIFAGVRVALNDVRDTELLVGAIVDQRDQSTAAFVEFDRRLGNSIKLELESRLFFNTDPQNLLHAFENDSFVNVRLGWHF